MIIAGQDHTLEMGGNKTAPSEFKILNSAAAFGILSSGLYSDKITAVAREIICNAYDAHNSVGMPEHPIEVHLPTSLEPYFSVKDCGTGLCHDDVIGLYTTYFGTTKGGSNDDIGGFGLGSKSPFAYTSGFTVVSVQDGTARTYSAMLSESGVPVITLMDEEPTSGPNGIEVSMPVKQNDMHEFRVKTQKVLEFFPDHKTNLSEFKAFKTEYTHKGEGWAIRNTKKDQHLGHTKPRAMVGKVAYLFPTDMSGLTDEQKTILGLPIDLFFGIGQLDVTPSRESLSMTKRSIANIKDRLQGIYDHILESLRAEIAAAPSLWFAKLALKERLQSGSPFRVLIQKVVAKYFGQYENFVLDEISTQVKLKDYKALTILHRDILHRTGKPNKTIDVKGEVNYKGLSTIQTSEDVVFYMNDSMEYAPRLTKRILELHEAEGRKVTLYLIHPTHKSVDPAVVSKEFASIVNDLGDPEVLFVSDLPPKPKVVRGPKAPSDTLKYAWVMLNRYYHSCRDQWTKAKGEDLDGDGLHFYLPIDRLEPIGMDTRLVQGVWEAARTLNLTIETEDDSATLDRNSQIIGLNAEGVKRVAELSNWVNIFSYIKENAPEVPKEYTDYLAAQQCSVSFDNAGSFFTYYSDKTNGDLKALKQLLRGTDFHRQAVLIKRVKQLLDRRTKETPAFKSWETLVNFTQQSLTVKKAMPSEISKLVKLINVNGFTVKYPMLKFIESYWEMRDKDNQKLAAAYIHDQEA